MIGTDKMTKTQATHAAEQYLYDTLLKGQKGIYGCHEVTAGVEILKKGREIIDFLTYDTQTVFRAYEIKVSKADLKSSAKLSFVGHYNYLVMPEALYDDVRGTGVLPYGVGVIIIGKGLVKKASRKRLSMGQSVKLLESLIRSLNRENIKTK